MECDVDIGFNQRSKSKTARRFGGLGVNLTFLRQRDVRVIGSVRNFVQCGETLTEYLSVVSDSSGHLTDEHDDRYFTKRCDTL